MNGSPSPLSCDLLSSLDQLMVRFASKGDPVASDHLARLSGDKKLVADFLLQALLKNCDRIGSQPDAQLNQEAK